MNDGSAPSTTVDQSPDLTALVRGARRGLRRDVALLEAALDDGELWVPLAQPIAGVREGEATPLDRELAIVPHFLRDAEGLSHAALFTRSEYLAELGRHLGWLTGGEELSACALPARVACELSLSVLDEREVHGLVLDPTQPSELFLRRSEVASLVSGQPLPLVGYVSELPPLEGEKVLVAEPSEPPPPALVAALERCLAERPAVTGHRCYRSFNPERDLEPHLTVSLTAAAAEDRRALAEQVIAAIGEHVPPPGYVDVVFDDG